MKTHPLKGKCDLCGKSELETWWDSPVDNGSWAFMCESCFEVRGTRSVATHHCYKEAKPPKHEGETVDGLERNDMAYFEEVAMGEIDREIECPLCGDTRTLEPDGSYFNCNCGARVSCPSMIC